MAERVIQIEPWPIKRILCPVDFSETSQHAFAYADRLAESLDAELLIAHAFDRPAELNYAGQTHPAVREWTEQINAVSRQNADAPVRRMMHVGPPGAVICWLAQDQQCELTVMGTHGRTGLSHLVFGSVAEYVLKHSRCPVITIRLRPVDEEPLKEPLVLPLPPPRLL